MTYVDRERGSVTPFIIVMGMTLIVAVGLVVDGGGLNTASQRVERVAAEAARAGGQQINGDAVSGDYPTANPGQAIQAAQAHLSAAGVDGTVSVAGSTLTVSTTDSYSPVILPIGSLTVTGHAEVRLGRT